MKFGFIGAGNMGSAILRGFIKEKAVKEGDIFVYDSYLENVKSEFNVNFCSSAGEVAENSDFVILAVKPNVIPVVVKEISTKLKKNATLISIAAGVTTENIYSLAGVLGLSIVRIMPNINATIGCATSAYCKNSFVSDESLNEVVRVFSAVGKLFYVEEDKFPIFTAISGSAPAFVFMFIEAISKGALKAGFSKAEAIDIVTDMVIGSAKMLQKSGEHPFQLVDKVCSPGGTTISGVCTLDEFNFQSSIVKAIENTIKRDKELNG